jgi:hypothetical protein
MAHAVTPYLGQRHFYTALLTDYTAVLQTLIFAAKTFIIFDRPKNLGAEQSIPLRLERAIVNSFWFLYLAK